MAFTRRGCGLTHAEYHAATVTFAILGKLFIGVTFNAVYVHASELFPTEVRNVGVGSASMCARISSMAAAYVGGPLVSCRFSIQLFYFGFILVGETHSSSSSSSSSRTY